MVTMQLIHRRGGEDMSAIFVHMVSLTHWV